MKPLLNKHETTGREYADQFGHRLMVVQSTDHGVRLLDSAHPAVSSNLTVDGKGDPYLDVTQEEIDNEIQYMIDNDELIDGPEDETTRIRAIIRALLEREELPEEYMSRKDAIKDVWDNLGANISAKDGHDISCPNCFSILPESGYCDCTDYE